MPPPGPALRSRLDVYKRQGVGRLYYKLFQHPDGWRLVLWFSVVFNINLAILNMMPFPVLDGGHITMAAAEAIRRKPPQGRILEYRCV